MSNYNPWTSEKCDAFNIMQAGDVKGLENLPSMLQGTPNLQIISILLKDTPRHFGIILENDDLIFAAVDKIRSQPIFYEPATGKVSANALDLKPLFTPDVDSQALLQFSMAGYILGQDTLYSNLKSLQGGECLLYEKKTSEINVHRYYQYIPCPKKEIDEEEAMECLGQVIDVAMKRTIENANGHKIWVPLSGGLDSRIVAAKLHEFGYDNMELFSYGMRGNAESKLAKEVAERLGVKWLMLPSNPKGAYNLFKSDVQKQYEYFSHAYSTIPNYVEFEAIHSLKKTGLTKKDDFIINGQTGDYICGAHIPSVLYESDTPSHQDMLDFILGKHFSLWESLKTPDNIEIVSAVINDLLIADNPDLSEKENLISHYESFEWAERQCKMVVHGQRTYEFFGFNWALPLWDGELVDFYETMPLHLKYQRKLFRKYVESYNYCCVFELPTAIIKSWKNSLLPFMLVAGKVLEITRGLEHKKDFYKKMSYYGPAHNQFSFFEKSLYDTHFKDIRNMTSLNILEFCDQHNLPFSTGLGKEGK